MAAGLTPDDRRTHAVEERLTSDERTKDMAIQVTTIAGEVTLRGAVDSEAIKEAAEQIARSVPGVVLVVNELMVTTSQERAEASTIPRAPEPSVGTEERTGDDVYPANVHRY